MVRLLHQKLAQLLSKYLIAFAGDKVLREALQSSGQYKWGTEDQKSLEGFLKAPTGAKLMVHLNSALSGMVVGALGEEDDTRALAKLRKAQGFSLAIGAIRLSTPEPYVTEELTKDEEEEEKKNDPFIVVRSSPAIF